MTNDPRADIERGIALQDQGKLREAEAIYRRLLAKYPNHAQILVLLGELSVDLNAPEDAVAFFARASTVAPRSAPVLNNLANAQGELFNYDAAIEALERAVAIDPSMPQGWYNLARLLNLTGDADRALELARRHKTREPGHIGARTNIVRSLAHLGHFEEALAEAQDIIARWPDKPEGYIAVAPLRKFAAGDALIAQAQRLIDKKLCPPGEIANLQFTLGKMYDDAAMPDLAFRAFGAANELSAVPYHRGNIEAYFGALAQTYSKALFEQRRGQGYKSDTPILIVGMPRSGTTLVESILAAHPDVASVGEVMFQRIVRQGLPAFVARDGDLGTTIRALSAEGAEFLGRRYVDMLRRRARSTMEPRIIDKLPHNFSNLGFAALTLPGARIIHVRRSPMATCFSCWTQGFNRAHEYAARFEDLAHHFAQYRKLMAHWKEVIGERILDVRYEDVVQDPAGEAKRMLDWLGLASDSLALDQSRSLRVVTTASVWQVRQPIHGASVERWRLYEIHLEPLKRALESHGVESE